MDSLWLILLSQSNHMNITFTNEMLFQLTTNKNSLNSLVALLTNKEFTEIKIAELGYSNCKNWNKILENGTENILNTFMEDK